MFKTIKLTPKEDAMFQPGCFVMLHTESCVASGKLHPDAGRIGQIVSRRGSDMLVEFFADELFGKSDFCMIPLGHWAPVPRFLVEEYEPRAKKRGWRLNASGVQVYRELGWAQTPATIGEKQAREEATRLQRFDGIYQPLQAIHTQSRQIGNSV